MVLKTKGREDQLQYGFSLCLRKKYRLSGGYCRPPSNIASTLQIGDSTKNGLLQLATLLHTNQITNDVINNQEKQRNILAATINLNTPKITTTHTTTNKTKKYNVDPIGHQIVTISIYQTHQHAHSLQTKEITSKAQYTITISNPPPLQTVNLIYDQHGIKLSLNNLLRNNPIRWYQALSNEFGR